MKKLYQSKTDNMKFAKIKITTFIYALLVLALQNTAFAVEVEEGEGAYSPALLGSSFNVGSFLSLFYKIAMPIAVILALINVAKAAYAIMFSEGDPRRVTEGKEDLTSAIMGLLFVLLSVAILRIIMGQIIIGGSAGF